MKKNLIVAICAFVTVSMLPQQLYAQKKEKKEKKAYEWIMPELSGNSEVDTYLLKCDTLYNEIQNYCNNITFYEMAEITVKDADGNEEKTYQIVDENGNLRSSNLAFQQNLQLVLAYPAIALDMTNLALAQAAAVAAAPKLGLGAVKYGKYIKAGPNIIKLGGTEMKKIYQRARAQAKQIKALKAGKIDEAIAMNAEVNAGEVDAGTASMKQITMDKNDYDTQLQAITAQDNENPITGDIPEEEVS